MSPAELRDWEARCAAFACAQPGADPGHGRAHLQRVVATARRLAGSEQARLEVVLPAAWLHDCVNVPKDSPQRPQASRLAAERAVAFLLESGFPAALLDEVRHAIEAHSYSAGIAPRSVEAQVVQDADRLDALGAIGLARCIAVGAALGQPLYDPADPFCERRAPDDAVASLDHFHVKLLGLAATMHTAAGRAEADRRSDFLRAFLAQLRSEIGPRA